MTNADLVVTHNAYPSASSLHEHRKPRELHRGRVSEFQLLRPGYAAGTTQVFTDDFLNALKPVGTLRYLYVRATNLRRVIPHDGPLDWSATPSPATRSGRELGRASLGKAWEYMIVLANASNTDMWITVPGTATDDYVTQLARLIKNGDTVDGVYYAGLKPSLKVYLEYSNEVWGESITPRATTPRPPGGRARRRRVEAEQRRRDRPLGVLSIAATLNGRCSWPTSSGRSWARTPAYPGSARSWAGRKTTRSRSWTSLTWFQSTFGRASQYFYGTGNANYWNATDHPSLDAILNSLAAGKRPAMTSMAAFTAAADFFCLKNVAYEGGPSVSGSGQAP